MNYKQCTILEKKSIGIETLESHFPFSNKCLFVDKAKSYAPIIIISTHIFVSHVITESSSADF